MTGRSPLPLETFTARGLTCRCMTTREITLRPKVFQDSLAREMTAFFPKLFPAPRDWEYMVRHFFYIPEGNTIRQAIFVRDHTDRLLALAAFDHGMFRIRQKTVSLIYVHIRAALPHCQTTGMGRIFSTHILNTLEPDILMSTCLQISSLYSWIHITDPVVTRNYRFFPGPEEPHLPEKDLDFVLACFKAVYISHVKEDNKRLEDVLKGLTPDFVRKGTTAMFNHPKWMDKGQPAPIPAALGMTENDAILLVVKRKDL